MHILYASKISESNDTYKEGLFSYIKRRALSREGGEILMDIALRSVHININ